MKRLDRTINLTRLISNCNFLELFWERCLEWYPGLSIEFMLYCPKRWIRIQK